MKMTKTLGIGMAVWIGVVSLNAWSQQATSATATASGTMTPKEIRTANRLLRRQIYAALGKHKDINAGNIALTAKQGAVTINGTVPDASKIDEVAGIVKGVPGVVSVTNKLMVQAPFGQ